MNTDTFSQIYKISIFQNISKKFYSKLEIDIVHIF
jgi:hypothetical protein